MLKFLATIFSQTASYFSLGLILSAYRNTFINKDVQEGYLFLILIVDSFLSTLFYCLLSKYFLGSWRLHLFSLLILVSFTQTIGNAGFGPIDQLDGDAFLIMAAVITFVCFIGIMGSLLSNLSIIFRIYLGSVRIFIFVQGISIVGFVSGGLLGSYLGDSTDFLMSFQITAAGCLILVLLSYLVFRTEISIPNPDSRYSFYNAFGEAKVSYNQAMSTIVTSYTLTVTGITYYIINIFDHLDFNTIHSQSLGIFFLIQLIVLGALVTLLFIISPWINYDLWAVFGQGAMIIGSIMIGPWLIGDIYEASYIGALIFLGGASIILLQIIPRLLTKYSITYDEFYDADKASLTIIIYMLLTPVGMMCTEIFVYFGKWQDIAGSYALFALIMVLAMIQHIVVLCQDDPQEIDYKETDPLIKRDTEQAERQNSQAQKQNTQESRRKDSDQIMKQNTHDDIHTQDTMALKDN